MNTAFARIRFNYVSLFVLGISILLFPYINLLYAFFPINFLGKNIWLVLLTVSIIALYFISLFLNQKDYAQRPFLMLFWVGLPGSILLSMREIAFAEGRSILDFRYIVVGLIFLFLARSTIINENIATWIGWTMVLSGLIQAATVIIHAHWFPHVVLLSHPDAAYTGISFDGERTRDGLLGASIGANQIICGMFALLAIVEGDSKKIYTRLFFYASLLIMCYAVTLSGSRYPQAIAAILVLSSLRYLLFSVRAILAGAILLGVGIIFAMLVGEFELLSNVRWGEDSGGRGDKVYLALGLLTDSVTNFLIGASSEETAAAASVNGYGISDNSYGLVALQFGVPFAMLFYTVLLSQLKRTVGDRLSWFFFFYMVIGFGLTNCILWESWIFMAMLTSIMLSRRVSYYSHLPNRLTAIGKQSNNLCVAT